MRDPASDPVSTTIRPELPIDLTLTLRQISRGGSGHSITRDRGVWWRATRTPDGPATIAYQRAGSATVVTAWGPGAAWAVEAAPEAVGARDDIREFDPPPGLVRDLHRRFAGLRIPRTKAVFETLLFTIIGQKVTAVEAGRSRRRLLQEWGEPAPAAPGGPQLFVLPPATKIAAHPYEDFHPLGLERRRANAIAWAAANSRRLEETTLMSLADARARLLTFPGVGPWSAAGVAGVALGDPDAVPVGDYHIPDTVAWALAGRARGNDELMLELLEPFAGQRGRVVRLLEAAGIAAPKFGPRSPVRSIRNL